MHLKKRRKVEKVKDRIKIMLVFVDHVLLNMRFKLTIVYDARGQL